MTRFFQVARREIAERRSLFVAGLAVGLVPLVLPILPGASANASEVRQISMLILLCAFAWGAAIMLGGSVWVHDLAEKRLGFYLARPVSTSALYGGKMLAAFALVLGASLLLLLPGMLGGGLRGHWLAGGGNSVVAVLVVAGSAALVPIAHAAGTVIRARDPWAALHLPLLVFNAAVVAWSGATITRAAVGPTAALYILGFFVLVPIVLLAAGFVQAAQGRTDPIRSHRALALAAWVPLIALALVGALGATWYAHPSPASLGVLWNARLSPDGRTAFVSGEGKGLRSEARWGFLLDSSNPDRFIRTGALVGYSDALDFSRDGSTAAWLAVERTGADVWKVEPEKVELFVAHLGANGITSRGTGISTPLSRPFHFTLSPRGTRAAIVDHGTVSVVDLASGRTLAAAKPPGTRGRPLPRFVGEDHVRLIEGPGEAEKQPIARDLGIFDLDVPARGLVRTGTIAAPPTTWVRTVLDASGARMLVFSQGHAAMLVDGRTGAAIADLGERAWTGTFLADGRIVVANLGGPTRTLSTYGPGGTPLRSIDLGPARWVRIAGQPSAATLLLGVQRTEAATSRASLVVDLETGAVLRELPGLTPLEDADLASFPESAPSRSTSLFMEADKEVVSIDLATGKRRTILPR